MLYVFHIVGRYRMILEQIRGYSVTPQAARAKHAKSNKTEFINDLSDLGEKKQPHTDRIWEET